jgi:preprotein translocase subunit SecG
MTTLFIILIILACIVLSLIVLVQNPKGGGLAGNVAGFSNQFMGVKQTTDILEKGTWIFAGLIALLCITSTFFIAGGEEVQDNLEKVGVPVGNSQKPATTTTLPPAAPASTDTNRR